MRPRRQLTVLLVGALAATACGQGGDGSAEQPLPGPTTSQPAAPASGLDGDWVVTSGTVGGEPVVLVDGRDITLSIDGDEISGTAACNGYGGAATFDAGAIAVGDVSQTEMGCEPDVQQLEQIYLGSLAALTAYEVVDGVLTLHGGEAEWVLAPVQPVADAAIVGTTWILDTVIEGGAASNSPLMDGVTLELHDDGTVTGSTSCRRVRGTWTASGADVRVDAFAAIDDPTAGRCAPDSEQLEAQVMAVLGDGFVPTVTGNRLTVTSADGIGLSFIAGSEPVTTDALDPSGGVDGPVAYSADPDDEIGEEALGIGVLTLRDGCLFLVGGDTAATDTLVLWPFGTTWREAPPAVVSAEGVVVPIGTELSVAGGHHTIDDLGWWTTSDEVVGFLRACLHRPGDEVFVIQHRVPG